MDPAGGLPSTQTPCWGDCTTSFEGIDAPDQIFASLPVPVSAVTPERTFSAKRGKRRAEHSRASRRRPSSVVRTRRRRSLCGGLDVIYAGDRGQPHPDTTPLVINPFFADVGHRRTEPGGYFVEN